MKNGPRLTFERRKSPRVELKGLTGMPEQADVARIVDISSSGAQVEFHSRLVPGNIYEMKLTFPQRQIEARVRVIRSMDLHDSGEAGDGALATGCLAGLEFLGLAPEDMLFLERYVADRAGREC